MNGNPSGGSGTYTVHHWTGTGAAYFSNPNIPDPVFSGAPVGPYTLTYTVTDGNGCIGSDNISITVNPLPYATETHVNVLCNGNTTGSINLTVISGTSPYTYMWTASAGGVVPAGQANRQDLTGLVAGTYNVLLTDANSCTTTQSITITQPTLPLTVRPTSNTPVCMGQTLNLYSNPSGGTPPYTYSWTGPYGFTSISQDPSRLITTTFMEGTYRVTVRDAAGCLVARSIDINIYGLPTAEITNNPRIICNGGSTSIIVTLTGTGPWSLINYNDGTPPPVTVNNINGQPYSFIVSPSVTTTYYVTNVSDAHNCSNTSNSSSTVTVIPRPTGIISGNATTCTGQSATLSIASTEISRMELYLMERIFGVI